MSPIHVEFISGNQLFAGRGYAVSLCRSTGPVIGDPAGMGSDGQTCNLLFLPIRTGLAPATHYAGCGAPRGIWVSAETDE